MSDLSTHTVKDKSAMHDAPTEKAASNWKRFLPLAVIAIVMAVAFSQGWHKALSINALIENREALSAFVADNFFLMLAGFVGLYIVVVTLSLPGAGILSISGGFLFGWLTGAFAIIIGAMIGAVLLFVAAKTALGATLREKAGPWLSKFSDGFQKDAFNYLLFLRLVPVFPFWLINLAPAMLGVPLTTYVLATFIGIIPGTFAFAFAGSSLNSVIDSVRAANPACQTDPNCAIEVGVGDLITTEILIAFGAIGCVALIPVIIKRIRGSKAA